MQIISSILIAKHIKHILNSCSQRKSYKIKTIIIIVITTIKIITAITITAIITAN
jgi:hypothetical protein